MKLWRDGVWWIKCAMWDQTNRFTAWVLECNDRAVDRFDQ